MSEKVKLAIIICDRYKSCAGGKCFRALKNREGAFDIYADQEVELVGYTSCGGCPGGNIEYAGEEMVKNCARSDPPCHRISGRLSSLPLP